MFPVRNALTTSDNAVGRMRPGDVRLKGMFRGLFFLVSALKSLCARTASCKDWPSINHFSSSASAVCEILCRQAAESGTLFVRRPFASASLLEVENSFRPSRHPCAYHTFDFSTAHTVSQFMKSLKELSTLLCLQKNSGWAEFVKKNPFCSIVWPLFWGRDSHSTTGTFR